MNSAVVSKWQPQPWPEVPFGSLRLWDTGTFWYTVNPSEGTFDWSMMDAWLTAAQAGHQTVLYTLGATPQWASSRPHDQLCIAGPGTCDPPNDLNADGTGTDQHWKDYVTAVALHSKNSKTAHISAWEIWNEPFGAWEWNGTVPQMVRMAQDAYGIIKSIDPNAIVLSPSFYYSWGLSLKWLANYLSQGAGQYADVIAIHGYVFINGGQHGEPEEMLTFMPKLEQVLSAYNQQNKPIWDTEASWGDAIKTHFNDKDLQAGWLSRFYLLHRSYHIAKLYWFSYNSTNNDGTLWIPNPTDHRKKGTLLKAGIAFRETEGWLQGMSMSSGCAVITGAIWGCGLTGPNGYQGEVLWDTSKSCRHGACQTVPYAIGSEYVNYKTLDGQKLPIKGHSVPVGYKPILVENQ